MRILFFVLTSLVFGSLSAQESTSSDSIYLKEYSVKALQEDFQILRGSLEDFHPGLYMHRSQKEMDSVFNDSFNSLNEPLNEIEFFRKLVPSVSYMGCGHTFMKLPNSISRQINQKDTFFPFDVKVTNEKIFYIGTNSQDSIPIDPGNEIASINGLSADSIIALGLKVIWQDGIGSSAKLYGLSKYFRYFYSDFIDQPESFTVGYLDSYGRKKTVLLKALSLKSIRQYIKNREDAVSNDPRNLILEYKNDSTIGVLTIKAFFDWKEKGRRISMVKELQRIFEALERSKPDHLIIDVRNNGGGMQPWRLSAYLTDQSLTYCQQASFIYSKKSNYIKYQKPSSNMKWIKHKGINQIRPGSHKTKRLNDSTHLLSNSFFVKPFKPLSPQFKGKTYVLANGGTFSAASWFVSMAKSNSLAVVIGQETNGGYAGQTSMGSTFVTLPNSKLVINLSLIRFKHNIDPLKNPPKRGVIPDYQVNTTVEDVINGVDAEMKFTLQLINKSDE